MVPSDELQIVLRPREAYARLDASSGYIPFYILFMSLLIAACASKKGRPGKRERAFKKGGKGRR